jgi:hypothetical protein
MGLLQEKFQTVAPNERETHEWASPESARRVKQPIPQRVSESDVGGTILNALPPGQNIDDQSLIDSPAFPRNMGGETDVSHDWNEPAVRKGFKRFDVLPTDDQYTAEHVDTFYGEAVSDGETGFAERGNLLDRI